MSAIDNNIDIAINLPFTLHASKNVLGIFLVFGVLVACGTLYGSIRTSSIWFIITTVFFSLVIAAVIKTWKNPMGLEVTKNGFMLTNKGLFRKNAPEMLPWVDIESFGILNNGFKYVSYQFTKESGRKRLPGGYIIPVIFEAPAEEIAMLLDGIRQGSLQHQISSVVFRE